MSRTKAPFWLRILARPALSRAMGYLVRLRVPRPFLRAMIRWFSRSYGVNLAEARLPVDAYDCFQSFFTRQLGAGLRPIDSDPSQLPSPCDGVLSVFGELGEGVLVQAKGIEYGLDALLGDANDAAPYRNGGYAVIYLAPHNYHRVHAPWRGEVTHWRYLPGALYPVNATGVARVPGLFTRNERIVGHFETEFGKAAMIMVGATCVGHMTVSFADVAANAGHPGSGRVALSEPVRFERGDEFGVFQMGSTVVLVFERPDFELTGALGDEVLLGKAVLRLPEQRDRQGR